QTLGEEMIPEARVNGSSGWAEARLVSARGGGGVEQVAGVGGRGTQSGGGLGGRGGGGGAAWGGGGARGLHRVDAPRGVRDSVRRRASASRRTLPAGASTAFTRRAGSTVCGQAASYDSFPASLDRLKGVRVAGTLDALPDGAPEARPLNGVEVSRPRLPGKAELDFRAFQLPRRRDRTETVPIAAREVRLVGAALRRRYERLAAPDDSEHSGIDRR